MQELSIKGHARLFLWRKGKLLWTREHENIVTSAGKDAFADHAVGGAIAVISHMAVGSDNMLSDETMTALQGTEHQRLASTVVATGNVMQVTEAFGPGLAGQVSAAEFGLFNAAAAGTMFARFTTNPFSLDPSEVLDVVWSLAFGD